MDWDLWGPPSDLAAEEADWHCDFCFGPGFDVVEENVLNEKCCVHVLRILITKADSEIDELEQDLVFLKSELAWIEKEEWSEKCCNALTEKINYLDVSIRSLRTNNKNDVEVHLLMHTQPAGTLHDLLKALLQNDFRKRDQQDSSSESADKGSPNMKMAADIRVNDCNLYSIGDASEFACGHSNKDHSINSDSTIISKENDDHSSISTSDVNIGSTIEPATKEADSPEKVLASSSEKPENSFFQELGLNLSQNAIGHFDEMKKLCKSNIKVTGIKKVREDHSRTASKRKMATSLFKPEVKGNSPRTDKGKCSKSGTEQRLCDFALKAVQKRIMKVPKLAAVDDNSTLRMEGKRKIALQFVKDGPGGLTDTELCALTTLIELHNKEGKTVTKQCLKEEWNAMPKEVKAAEIDDKKEPKLNVYLNSQKKKAKRKSPPILQEIDSSTMTVVPNSSSISNCQKHQNSGLSHLNGNVTCILNGENEMKVVQLGEYDCKAKKHGATPDDHRKLVSQPQKRRKKSADFPTSTKLEDSRIQSHLSDLLRNTAGGASKDDLSAAKPSSNSCSDSVVPVSLPSAVWDLKDLKVVDLRAIAKELKLSKYHKLSKKDLLELINSHAGNC